MTIGAAFRYRDGILLCADTELTGWAMTLHASKIIHFDCPSGKIAMVYAGNTNFATAAMQKCKRRLLETSANNTLMELERVLDREYRKTAWSHPSHAIDPNLPYWLLISICSPDGKLSLYATDQTSMRQIEGYECIGIGDALAHYLVRPSFSTDMREREVLALATFMLACVKGNVPGCGGMSQFLALRRDGTIGEFFAGAGEPLPTNTDWLERHSKSFETYARRILFAIPNPDLSDAEFEGTVDFFKRDMLRLRADWRQTAFVHESIKDALEGKPKTRNLEDSLTRPRTKDDPSRPQPSPEKPGGSDES